MQTLKDNIIRVMTEYRQSVIDGEEARAKKEKREPNPNIKSTIFLWIAHNIERDLNSLAEMKQETVVVVEGGERTIVAIQELVNEGKLIHHPVHTACYYLPA